MLLLDGLLAAVVMEELVEQRDGANVMKRVTWSVNQ